MSNKHQRVSNKPPSSNLQSLFRSQIVQNYPPTSSRFGIVNQSPIFIQEEVYEEDRSRNEDILKNNYKLDQQGLIDIMMQEEMIVEQYNYQDPASHRRSLFGFDNIMASESDDQNVVQSRNSSLSSKENHLDFQNKSFENLPSILKKYSDQFMDVQDPVQNQHPLIYRILETPIRMPMKIDSIARDREKSQKITKLQQVGCNCRKSKCLKMYCECFHLQIFCSQNCNCVGCGNIEPNQGHQKAVIDALTRNPKAFEDQKPAIQNSFTLGVELAEVKKGCKCKKTKCLKKYCECYNSGGKCGIFCKCENCENTAN